VEGGAQLVAFGPFQPQLFIRLAELDLPARANTFFDRLGLEFVGDLVCFSTSELFAQPNLGRTTVRKIESHMLRLGLALGMDLLNWELVNHELVASKYGIDGHTIGRAPAGYRPQLVPVSASPDLKSSSDEASASSVEEEVERIFSRALKPRAQTILTARIAWREEQTPTLQVIGDAFQISRERIRQIIACANKRVAILRLEAPLTRLCLERVAELLPGEAAQVEGTLVQEGLLLSGTRLRAILTAANVLGIDYDFALEKAQSSTYVLRAETKSLLVALKQEACRMVESCGWAVLEDVVAAANQSTTTQVPKEFAAHRLHELDGFAWLAEREGWFWLDGRRNRLLNNIDKALCVGRSLELSELRAAVRRHHRMRNSAPPRGALLELCRQLEDCEVDGTRITDVGARDPTLCLSESEQILRSLLLQHGPVVAYRRLEELALWCGIPSATYQSNMSNSPMIRRYGREAYGLVGAQISEEQIVGVQLGTHRNSVRRDWGYTPEGDVWVDYQLSAACVTNGVFSVPAITENLAGRDFDVHNISGVRIATLRIKNGAIWGFLPYFGRHDPEAGDHMRVTLRLRDGTASIELGEQTDEGMELTSSAP